MIWSHASSTKVIRVRSLSRAFSADANGQTGVRQGARFTVQSMVQHQQGCDTNVKYNNEPSKTGVPKNAPVGSWRAGMQHYTLN